MTGKIANALIRREADIYRSHGLSKEARDLYQNLLASSPHISPVIKAAIESQLQQIELEIGCAGPEECQALSDEQIAIIKQGWGKHATVEDIVTCATSFYQMGRYADALDELKKLGPKGFAPKRATGAIAACLVQLHRPEALPAAADQLASELFRGAGDILSFQLAVAEKLYKRGRGDHCRLLLRHVGRHRSISPEIRSRIVALAKEMDASVTSCASEPSARRGAHSDGTAASARSGFDRIRGAAKALGRRLLSKCRM
jgi:tetratricopeptide (TPR) repeat protein